MAKVIKRFRDKVTKKIYTPGDKETGVYDGSPERIKELVETGFLLEDETRQNGEGNHGTKDTLLNGTKKDILADMTVSQLKDVAKENNIEIPKDITKKDDIVKFLSDYNA